MSAHITPFWESYLNHNLAHITFNDSNTVLWALISRKSQRFLNFREFPHITKSHTRPVKWALISQYHSLHILMSTHITKAIKSLICGTLILPHMSHIWWWDCSQHWKINIYSRYLKHSFHVIWLIISEMSTHFTWIWGRPPKCRWSNMCTQYFPH